MAATKHAREIIKLKVKEILVEQLGVDEDEVTDEAHLETDLGADSLDCVEIIMAFEEEFGLEIPDEEAEKIKTPNAIVDYLDRAEVQKK